jgi:hypothetical protein
LTRVSIDLREESFEEGWIAGSSPAMTTVMCACSRVKLGNDEVLAEP